MNGNSLIQYVYVFTINFGQGYVVHPFTSSIYCTFISAWNSLLHFQKQMYRGLGGGIIPTCGMILISPIKIPTFINQSPWLCVVCHRFVKFETGKKAYDHMFELGIGHTSLLFCHIPTFKVRPDYTTHLNRTVVGPNGNDWLYEEILRII